MIRKEFDFECISPVPICDIEIGNDISTESGEWEYEKSDIITLGIFHGKKIIILQREKTDKIDFWKDCLKRELKNVPVMYCLNANMEKKGISGYIGMNKFFEDVRPFRGKNTSKDKIFNFLVKEGQVPKPLIPEDPLKGNASLVQQKYKDEKYEDIILHNKNCLVKEYFIFMNKFWLLEKFKDKIKNGWWNDSKPFGED